MRSDLLAGALVAALAACSGGAGTDRSPAPLTVPAAGVAVKIDGEPEAVWNQRALRVQLQGQDGQLARPYSEARFLDGGDDLLIELYAADEDVRSTDHFSLTLGSLAFQVDVRGRITPAIPGARAAVDLDPDTTVDDPSDDDEEWVVEMSLPRQALGAAARLPAGVERCDTTKDGVEHCAVWHGALAP